jgi:putative redox protein
MKHEIETQWMGKMQFNALVNGHTVVMDAPERSGGEDMGPIPKPLLLTALSGCSGMDVVALLRKSGSEISDFSMKVEGELSKGAPVEYVAVSMQYIFKGPEASRNAAIDAVRASQEKYCGVSHMLKKILPVAWNIVYNDVVVFSEAGQGS